MYLICTQTIYIIQLYIFNVSNMFMCLGLTSWDWIIYQGKNYSTQTEPGSNQELHI